MKKKHNFSWDDIGEVERYKGMHDLTLPDWGPYSSRYAGISHIADRKKGLRLDYFVIPGFHSGKGIFPDVRSPYDYHIWDANRELSYYAYRFELIWKDKVYVDMEFFRVDETSRLLKLTFRNNQSYAEQFCLTVGMQFEGCPVELNLQPGELWIGGEEYVDIETRNIQTDGLRRGVVPGIHFLDRKALGGTFPEIPGNWVAFNFTSREIHQDAALYFHYASGGDQSVRFDLSLDGKHYQTYFPPTGGAHSFNDLHFHKVVVGRLPAGKHRLQLKYSGEDKFGGSFVLDGFICASSSADMDSPPRLKSNESSPNLNISQDQTTRGIALSSFLRKGRFYGIHTGTDEPDIWTITGQEIGDYIRRQFDASHFQRNFWNHHDVKLEEGNQHLMIDIGPLFCKPRSEISVYLPLAFAPSRNELFRRLHEIYKNRLTIEQKERKYHQAIRYSVSGKRYAFSQERMMALSLTSVGYPVELKEGLIKYFNPGKCCNCQTLYLWDAGFQGLGLLEYSPKLALETMNTYLTNLEDREHPLILHGTPLPVQIYLLWEIYQRTLRKDILSSFYPPMKRFYRFMAGTDGISTFDKFGTGLLNTFDQFYNSGGWDDYPPQVYVHQNNMAEQISPVANTAHAIRAAKLMRLMAKELALEKDIAEYTHDVEYMEEALLRWAWDEKSGYFGYVFNKNKRLLRWRRKVNFNMGLDGVTPLFSDICSSSQVERMVSHLRNPQEMWTPLGISAVDRTAPYYRDDGYWTGRVWMPHQWFVWKALIGYGKLSFARKIAQTAIDLWRREVARTYHLSENFVIRTGRGAGMPQFPGLSCPVLNFYSAYYEPGMVTVGFDTVIHSRRYLPNKDRLELVLSAPFAQGRTGVVAVMRGNSKYLVSAGGRDYSIKATAGGAVMVCIPLSEKKTTMTVVRREIIGKK